MKSLILDPCCGSRMFYFDKTNPLVLFGDNRSEEHILCDGRKLSIHPDVIMDFTQLEFADRSFKLVVFDPPHLKRAGKTSWVGKKYGILNNEWQTQLTAGFAECFRVLDDFGMLIFKWNETQIPVSKILALTPYKPVVGHKSGRRSNTHWICFMKMP